MLTAKLFPQLADAVELKPITTDNMSDIRYVHATAFRLQAAAHMREEEIQAFTDLVYSPQYVDKILNEDLHAAWFGTEMIGTGGWCPADDNGSTARIRSIFVRPLFTGNGIGQRLVKAAEERARRAGFTQFSTRATINAEGFFELLGYEVTSHGVRNVATERGLPVKFMRKTGAARKAAAAQPADAEARAVIV